jgi:hypothetical protein
VASAGDARGENNAAQERELAGDYLEQHSGNAPCGLSTTTSRCGRDEAVAAGAAFPEALMPLPFLFSIPDDPQGSESFFFWHANDHFDIQTAVQKQMNVPIVDRILYPFVPSEQKAWLERHQQTHDDIIAALDLNIGTDLTDVDFNDPESVRQWVYDDAEEHQAMRNALKI